MLKKTELTSVEQHLLHALSTGASNKHMARHLGKSEFTIRNQLSGVFRKIQVINRMQAAFWYREYLAVKKESAIGTSAPLHHQQGAAKMLARGSVNEACKTVTARE